MKTDWSSFDRRHAGAGADRHHDAQQQGPQSLDSHFSVAAPYVEASGQHLGKEWQEQRCHHDGDGIVLDDSCGQQRGAGGGSTDIARGNMAQLPAVLDDFGKRLTQRLGKGFHSLTADDGRTSRDVSV